MELLTFISFFESYTHLVIHDAFSNYVVCGGSASSLSCRSILKKKNYVALSCQVLDNVIHIYVVPN